MRALVAGGAGFIGSHLCELLLARGDEVLCVDNLSTGSKENVAHLRGRPGFGFAAKDVTRPLRVTGRLDVIFNLASPASPKDYLALPFAAMAANSQGAWNLLELARRRSSVYVQASTSEVYGDPLVHPQVESYCGNVNPIGPRAVYDEAKRFAEALVMTYHRGYGLPVRIARIFNTYGPRMKLNDGRVVPALVHQALTGKPLSIFGDGRQTRSFCYVSDMVEALYRLSSCSSPLPINLGNPHEFTILRFARLVRRLTGSRSPVEFKPLPEDDPKRRRPNITRAIRLLGWRPQVELEQGLKLTIEWFRNRRLM